MSVLALEMSRPVSTIVVQTSTSNRFSQKSTHDLLELVLAHLPVGHGDPGLGHELAEAGRGPLDRLDTLLWTKKTWPSRSSSRRIAAVICFSS